VIESQGTRRGRGVAPYVVVAALAAVAALLSLAFVTVGRDVGPGRLEVHARASWNGHTELGFPPLGQVTAGTHATPLAVNARVERLDVEELQELLNGTDPEATLRREVEAGIGPLVRAYALRALLIGLVAGALVGALVPGRRVAYVLTGGVTGVVVIALLLGVTWRDYQPEAFDEPRYDGALERAPQIIDAVERHVEDLPAIRDRVDVLSARIARLYAIATVPPEPDESETVRILHVSDIHSNPLALEIVQQLAERFDVAAVLDTGDLTSFGYPIESQLGQLISRIDRPYLFVPGNHDSDANRSALAQYPNVQLIDREAVDIDGVDILGVADPTFTASNEIDDDEAAATKGDFAPSVERLVRRERPDVLAVHDRRLATDAFGSVPLVVSGHFHERSESIEDGTRVLTVGSTGATGIGSFMVDDDLAYEGEILHFVDGELRLVDYFSLEGVTGNYRIERQIITPTDEEQDT
jgi:Icc-related predicted phosphoesterase